MGPGLQCLERPGAYGNANEQAAADGRGSPLDDYPDGPGQSAVDLSLGRPQRLGSRRGALRRRPLLIRCYPGKGPETNAFDVDLGKTGNTEDQTARVRMQA